VAGTFATWQPEYEARGLATFPLRSDDRKRPAVGNYNRMGMPASRQLVLKWGEAEGLACMAGARNRLTVVDIDARGAEGERLLADIQGEIGQSRFIVRTGGGGFHAYYKHNGEGRRIRFDPQRPIDLLGGGQIVLPPSMGSKARYEVIHGKLDDLAGLSTIRRAPDVPREVVTVTTPTEPFADMRANSGRNTALFDALCKEARHLPPNLDAFINRARELNQSFGEPMIDSRVVNTAKSVFGYLETGTLRTGEHGAWFKRPQAQELAKDPYLAALLMWLKAENGPDAEFWVADGLAEPKYLDWPRERLQRARRRAIDDGWIVQIRKPVRRVAALYRWGPTALDHGLRISVPYPQ
jgi:Bifunctional DNA primase/polymerase, N-terminal